MVHPGYRCQGLGGCGDPCGPDDFACSGEREHELEILNSDKLKEFYLKQNFKLYPTILWDNTYWTYPDRLKRVNLHSLELRRLYMDLYYCYKMLFGLVDIKVTDFFEWTPHHNTRGHNFKLYKKSCTMRVRSTFFSERVVNVWNNLPASVDFKSLSSFECTVKLVDLSKF